MSPPAWLVGLTLAACTDFPPRPAVPELYLTADPTQIDAMGQPTHVAVRALEESGRLGTGRVVFSARQGSLAHPKTVPLVEGVADEVFSCFGCAGTVTVHAAWTNPDGGIAAERDVFVQVNP